MSKVTILLCNLHEAILALGIGGYLILHHLHSSELIVVSQWMWASVIQVFHPLVVVINEGSWSEFHCDVSNLSIESWIGCLFTSDSDSQIVNVSVVALLFESLHNIIIVIFHNTNCLLLD